MEGFERTKRVWPSELSREEGRKKSPEPGVFSWRNGPEPGVLHGGMWFCMGTKGIEEEEDI